MSYLELDPIREAERQAWKEYWKKRKVNYAGSPYEEDTEDYEDDYLKEELDA